LSLHVSIISVHGPPRLHFESLKLQKIDLNAEPDPAFRSIADPDPASKNNAYPCGSGSATLAAGLRHTGGLSHLRRVAGLSFLPFFSSMMGGGGGRAVRQQRTTTQTRSICHCPIYIVSPEVVWRAEVQLGTLIVGDDPGEHRVLIEVVVGPPRDRVQKHEILKVRDLASLPFSRHVRGSGCRGKKK
jgi:hypothetical protein